MAGYIKYGTSTQCCKRQPLKKNGTSIRKELQDVLLLGSKVWSITRYIVCYFK